MHTTSSANTVSGYLRTAFFLACAWPAAALAQTPPVDLTKASLEDLLSVTVVSASKKPQPAEDVAAAVTVLTHDDIVRSGVRSLPEVFRLVPGIQVARVTASNWAISVRGFNDLFVNKVLVLIDGRSIYNRQFSGVFWDTEDLSLDDIDHIEVVRGSGGAIWGANAMNGVINIVTRSSKDTIGGFVRSEVTSEGGSQTSARYGWGRGDTTFRVSSVWNEHGATLVDRTTSAGDAWRSSANAFRMDWAHGAQTFVAEGNFLANHTHPEWLRLPSFEVGAPTVTDGTSDRFNASALGRWTYTSPAGGVLQVQSFVSRRVLDDPVLYEIETTADLDVQYQRRLGVHEIVIGGGYRDADDVNTSIGITYSVTPATTDAATTNLFAQDEVSFGARVKATVGARLEHDDVGGWTLQPSLRGIWLLDRSRQRVWGAITHATRPPAEQDLGIRVNEAVVGNPGGLPLVIGFVGNPEYQSEQALDTEAGYRIELASKVSVDVSAFRGSYQRLKTNEPLTPSFEPAPFPHLFVATQYQNLLAAVTTGVEVSGRWTPLAWWTIDGSFSGFHVSPHPDPASLDTAAATTDANTPARQWQARSTFNVRHRTQLDLMLYHVGEIRSIANPAYTRGDLNVTFKLTRQVNLTATGQNLLMPSHFEFPYIGTGTQSNAVPRTGAVQLSWRF